MEDIDLEQFWWEQYPRPSETTAAFVESERLRVSSELRNGTENPGDHAWYESIRSDPINGFDHGKFAVLIMTGLWRHVSEINLKLAEKWKGKYDSEYGDKCRTYEGLLRDSVAVRDWHDAFPKEDQDINALPEPITVLMLVSGVLDDQQPGQVNQLLKELSRFRPPHPKK